MTAIKRIAFATIALAVALALATVNPASALARTPGPAVPFQSRSSGTTTFHKEDGTLTGEESGVSSQLGKVTIQYQNATGTIDEHGVIKFQGELTAVAANGDQLTGSFETTGDITKQTSKVKITGGTGRFADATGEITVVCITVGTPKVTQDTVSIERECTGTGELSF